MAQGYGVISTRRKKTPRVLMQHSRGGPTPGKDKRPVPDSQHARLHETMPQEPDESQWWLDDRVWLDLFEPLFNENPELAARAAKLWHRLLAELENGSKGATHAMICIENALMLTFPFTKTYQACRILFEVSLGEKFPPNLDTMELLTEAMKRTKAALVVKQRKQHGKRSRR